MKKILMGFIIFSLLLSGCASKDSNEKIPDTKEPTEEPKDERSKPHDYLIVKEELENLDDYVGLEDIADSILEQLETVENANFILESIRTSITDRIAVRYYDEASNVALEVIFVPTTEGYLFRSLTLINGDSRLETTNTIYDNLRIKSIDLREFPILVEEKQKLIEVSKRKFDNMYYGENVLIMNLEDFGEFEIINQSFEDIIIDVE